MDKILNNISFYGLFKAMMEPTFIARGFILYGSLESWKLSRKTGDDTVDCRITIIITSLFFLLENTGKIRN